MPDTNDFSILKRGVDEWNQFRLENPDYTPDLSDAWLCEEYLAQAELSEVNLSGAQLYEADLRRANLDGASLISANLSKAKLRRASLVGATLREARLRQADLTGADLSGARLIQAELGQAVLRRADLVKADLNGADLRGADLAGADLSGALLVDTNLFKANLSSCRVYGVSAWDVDLTGAIQSNLIFTAADQEFEAHVGNLRLAQFMYLMMNNASIREAIDTLTTKVVLILGRFTADRIGVLDAVADKLRHHDYVPVLFDFDKPLSRDTQETITLLARMARFVIADITDPRCIPQELVSIVETLPSLPVQPLLEAGSQPWGMFDHVRQYPWVLPIVQYEHCQDLLKTLERRVLKNLEKKVEDLESRRSDLHSQPVRADIEAVAEEEYAPSEDLTDPHRLLTDEEIEELDGGGMNLTADEARLLEYLDNGGDPEMFQESEGEANADQESDDEELEDEEPEDDEDEEDVEDEDAEEIDDAARDSDKDDYIPF